MTRTITFDQVHPGDIVLLHEPALQFHHHMIPNTPLYITGADHDRTDVHIEGWYITARPWMDGNLMTVFTGATSGAVTLLVREATSHDLRVEAVAAEQRAAQATIHLIFNSLHCARTRHERAYWAGCLRAPFIIDRDKPF